MAKQLFVVRRYGNTWGNMPYVNGKPVLPCLTLDPDPPDKSEERLRPTGEAGSGPYFHSFTDYPNGVQRGWSNGSTIFSDCMNYSERHYDPDSYTMLTVKKTFSNGDYYWEYQYSCLFSWYYWEWRESASWYIVRWNGPMSSDDKSMYPECLWATDSGSFEHVWGRQKPSHGVFEDFCWAEAEKTFDSVIGANIHELGHIGEMGNQAAAGNLIRESYPKPSFHWKFGEATAFEWWRITGYLPPMFQSLANAAYIEAIDSIPDSGCNSIATVLEVAGSISELLHGRINTVKSLGDVWLQYRYVITTNKADLEAYADLTRRLVNLARQPKVTLYGEMSAGEIRCSCTCDVDIASAIPTNVAEWLDAYGFRLSAVNMWDMVPYSFVVDWFLHVGDWLEELEKMGNAQKVSVSNCWFSFRSNYQNQDTYLRVPGEYAAAFPYVSYKRASGKTTVKRILDAVVLFG